MTIQSASRWRRGFAFLAANALLLAGVYFVLLGPLIDIWADQQRQIERRSAMLARMNSLLERKPLIASQAGAAQQWTSGSFLQGETLTQLNSDFLARLRQLAERHQISFSSLASRPPRAWRGYEFVGAQIEFTAPSARASAVLAEIDHGLPLMFVHSARLSAPARGGTGEEAISASLEIYGATQWRK